MMKRMMGLGAALTVASLAFAPGPSAAQIGAAMPWLGCWVEVGAAADAAMLCFVPENGGVSLLSVDRSGVQLEQKFRPDGTPYPISTGGCEGTETISSSSDGARLFSHSELACEGGTERLTYGLMAMVAPDEWVHVRTLVVQGSAGAWTHRYRSAPARRLDVPGLEGVADKLSELELAIESARLAAATRPSVDDVIEAHGQTHAEAVRSWIAEQGEPLRMDRDALLRLAEAGVSSEVIDVAIAVSYPDHFAVGKTVERVQDEYDDRSYRNPYSYRWGGFGWWPFYYDPWNAYPYSYRRYGGYYGYGSSYYGWGSYGWGGPSIVVVRPADDVDGERGRAIKGGGYSSGRSGVRSGTRATRRGNSTVRAGRGATRSTTSSAAPRSTSGSSSSSKGKAKPKGGGL